MLPIAALILETTSGLCPFKLIQEQRENLETERRRAITEATPGTTTVQGCSCKQACGATIDDAFTCDWCYTEGKCGHYSMVRLGYWDYCVYPVMQNYEAQTAEEKLKFLWTEITANTNPSSYENKFKVVEESVQTTFDTNWDWMAGGRHKVIHAVGVVCKVRLHVTSTKYTGILEQGSIDGLFRFGSATPPVNEAVNPGAGFKFLRSGVRSANWVMLDDPNLTDTTDFDLWNRNLTNHVSAFQGAQKAVALKFGQVSNCVTKVGLSNLATYNKDGVQATTPVFPWMLTMVPADVSAMPSKQTSLDGFLNSLKETLPKGTTFYTVKARESPFAEWEAIGSLTTLEDCVTSEYGDQHLFFQHQRIEEDWNLRGDWVAEASDVIKERCGYSNVDLVPPKKCSEKTESAMC